MLELLVWISMTCIVFGFIIWFFYPAHIYNKKNKKINPKN